MGHLWWTAFLFPSELYPIYIKLSYKSNRFCAQFNRKNTQKKPTQLNGEFSDTKIICCLSVLADYLFILLRKINITSDSVIQMTYWKESNTFKQIIK